MSEDPHQLKEIKTQTEQEPCSCCCMSHKKTDVDKAGQSPINQS